MLVPLASLGISVSSAMAPSGPFNNDHFAKALILLGLVVPEVGGQKTVVPSIGLSLTGASERNHFSHAFRHFFARLGRLSSSLAILRNCRSRGLNHTSPENSRVSLMLHTQCGVVFENNLETSAGEE